MRGKSKAVPGEQFPSESLGLARQATRDALRPVDHVLQEATDGGRIHVFLGVGDPTVEELLTGLLEKAVGGKRSLKFTSSVRAEEVLLRTASRSPDIFVLVLNNIIHPDQNLSVGQQIEESLRMVVRLKDRHRRPVIAFLGLPIDGRTAAKARAAGVDFLLPLPFALRDFEKAVEVCLSKTAPASRR